MDLLSSIGSGGSQAGTEGAELGDENDNEDGTMDESTYDARLAQPLCTYLALHALSRCLYYPRGRDRTVIPCPSRYYVASGFIPAQDSHSGSVSLHKGITLTAVRSRRRYKWEMRSARVLPVVIKSSMTRKESRIERVVVSRQQDGEGAHLAVPDAIFLPSDDDCDNTITNAVDKESSANLLE